MPVENISRELTHEKVEAQREQLPEWYPQSVWDEIEDASDKIDQPSVALPVYQKYLSESDAWMLIELFATPEGQATGQTIPGKYRASPARGPKPDASA